ncbi:Delta-like protein 4 [Trichinella zimbabwensis]|uniref:Delta-like protein 4 n=1 Tax=Trichinella zimbabwensis TaxID=268475 RepID=A0A0V1H3L1_9BILA|nr:Delta-like protein 4 [Trichinella zimbabwensis]
MNIITLFVFCMIINGLANAGCPVSSSEHDFGGRSIGNGSCLTLVNVSAAMELYGSSSIIYLNKFCKENFKQGRLLRFINPEDLHVLSHANFKRHSTFNILLHPGVRLIHEAVYERVEAVFIEKCNKSELLNCKVVRYLYISDNDKPMEGRLYKCKEDRCCTGIDCSVVPPSLIYESPLVANVSVISGGTYCRCLSLDQQLLKWNLSNEVVYDCNAMPCDVFACLHDEYADCIDRKVPKACVYSVETKSCTQHSIERISEKEMPYGLDCKERDIGEPCSCPCVGTWSPWSTPSIACGNVTSVRYRPNLATIAENKTCSDVTAPCCKETQSTVVSCNDASTNRESEEFKLKCERNGGSVNMSGTELLCTCSNELQYGLFCENVHDPCAHGEFCQNGGTCINSGLDYTCDCAENFYGKNCTNVVKQCNSSSECLNGGYCDLIDSVKLCKCHSDFSGAFCEFRNGNCSDDAACLNGGSCHQVGDQAFKCVCTDAYTGTVCEIQLNIIYVYLRRLTKVFARRLNEKAETDSSKRSAVSRKRKRSRKQATANTSKSSVPGVKYGEKVDEPKNGASCSSEVIQATRRLKKKSKARRKYRRTLDKSEASSSVFEIARGLRKKALKSVSPKTVETVNAKTLSSTK